LDNFDPIESVILVFYEQKHFMLVLSNNYFLIGKWLITIFRLNSNFEKLKY